jgi:AmiR/NasT family two-component response regulator
MAKKRPKLEYEEPVTAVELETRLQGEAGRRLRRRIDQSGPFSSEIRSAALIEQATGFLAEALELSIDGARKVLIEDAAVRGLTLLQAAQQILRRED